VQQVTTFRTPGGAKDAARLQGTIAKRLIALPNHRDLTLVAGVDAVYGRSAQTLFVGVVVLSFPELELIERTKASGPVARRFPPDRAYFDEARVIRQALNQLQTTPHLVLVAGHGTAHPRGCGRAGHIGVEFDIPTIGCARRLLAGRHRDLAPGKGSAETIYLGGKPVGLALRTKDAVKPMFISPGHRCDLPTAVDIVQRCLRGFRMPEPLRLAHLCATKYRRRD